MAVIEPVETTGIWSEGKAFPSPKTSTADFS